MYETTIGWKNWPYKGTNKDLLKKGFETFYLYPKQVRKALWMYDLWDDLCDDDNRMAYVQMWAEATNKMPYPFNSLDEVAEYLIREQGYSYGDLIAVGYDPVNNIDHNDDVWVWNYGGELRSYATWTYFMHEFMMDDYYYWDDFIDWAVNARLDSSEDALKKALQFKDHGAKMDYMEMLGDYFGPYLDKLEGDKRQWFIRRIKAVYQVGDEDAERILLGGKAL